MYSNHDWKGFNLIFHSIHSNVFFGTWFCVEKNKHKVKLHLAYTSKNVTDNATGINWMSRTLSLQNFLNDARQL